MIISRTPLRISFLGGGSDLPAFYREEPGAVVSSALGKYIYINVNSKFDDKVRASYSVTEMVDKAADLRHELIREALAILEIDGGIEITSISDIPSQGTGLGSSSSYTVGLLNALYAYKGRHAGAKTLAEQACEVEIERCKKPIGKQDQYSAAFGGLQYIQFNPDETVFVDPILCLPETKAKLEARLMMLYTGLTRSADLILSEQSARAGPPGKERGALRCMKQLADEARKALESNSLDAFGELLHEGWELKKSLASGISSAEIDAWYALARKHGAQGGKLLGAGGGGFLLVYAEPERHGAIRSALSGLKCVPVQFEPQGSKIVYVEERRKS